MTDVTSPINTVRVELAEALQAIDISHDLVVQLELKPTPEGMPGDFGFHCAPLAKAFHKSPAVIAQDLAQMLKARSAGLIAEFLAVGPYLNFHLNYRQFSTLVQERVFSQGSKYGQAEFGNGQRIIVDLSSPNIAKRMSVGHLRSTIIGDSLARIFSHLGYEVIKDNHLGDWGTQFGHLLRAIELWGDEKAIAHNPIEELQKLYVQISDAGEPDSELYAGLSEEEARVQADAVKNAGREWFKRLENGDPEARARWQQIVDWSLQEFQKMYDILGVKFELVRGESFYEELLPDTIQAVRESGIATESQGALVVDMEDVGLGTAIIQKSDGATLYLTREIATGIHRNNVEHADGMIYVVGEDQKFYFAQFFEILRRMGFHIVEKSKHVYFGMITLPEGKMSTRKGRVVLLEDVVNEAMERTRQLVDQRTHVTSPEEKNELVRKVAVGALKWNDLMADPRRSILFNWDSMLTMDGNSAPYVQYAYARASSLLDGVNHEALTSAPLSVEHAAERALIRIIAEFPDAIQAAAEHYNPSKIATVVYELAKGFNTFYHEVSVLKAETPEKKLSRLALSAMVAQTLQIGLNLLGIEAPEKM